MMDLCSSWLISGYINVWDTSFPIPFNLLLASITILLCFFFLFLVIFNNFFIIPAVKEKIKLKFALALPTGAPVILAKEIIDVLLLVANEIIKGLPQ